MRAGPGELTGLQVEVPPSEWPDLPLPKGQSAWEGTVGDTYRKDSYLVTIQGRHCSPGQTRRGKGRRLGGCGHDGFKAACGCL